jgi:serine/threonine-protein kinase
VHRDLKPDNIFLTTDADGKARAKIVDFGISKLDRPKEGTIPLSLTGRGTVVGTPFYISPEQARAQRDVDGRADVYSTGAILFECLAGRPPHVGSTYEQVILAHCMKDAVDVRSVAAEVSPAMAALVSKALARDREARYGSALEMLDALVALAPELAPLLEGAREPTLAPPVSEDPARVSDDALPAAASSPTPASTPPPAAGDARRLFLLAALALLTGSVLAWFVIRALGR